MPRPGNRYTPLLERFENSYIPEPNSGCWIWTASTWNHAGSPEIRGKIKVNRKQEVAARVSYLLFKGDPADLFVCHRCDTPLCVNPDHLWLGTHADNMADMVAKGRSKKGRTKGAKQIAAYSPQPQDSRRDDMARIRVPRMFIDDHIERDLPTPVLHGNDGNGRQYVIDTDDPNIAELLSDARHYAFGGTDADQSIVQAAKRLVLRLKPYLG